MIHKKTFKIFSLVFIFCLQNIHALDITGKEIEVYAKAEHNRTYNFYGGISVLGAVELNNFLAFRGGVSFGGTSDVTDIKTLVNAGFSPFVILPFEKLKELPLDISVRYIYNGLHEYEAHTHSILHLISFNEKWAGISIGNNSKFSSHFRSTHFETILTFSAYLNFVNNENFILGIGCGNLSDFQAANLGALSLKFGADININKNWSVINEFELMQSGLDGFSTTFYGFAIRGGAKYKW